MTPYRPRHARALILLAGLMVWPAAAPAQGERVVPVGGRLVDPDGEPVRGARVAILSEKNNDVRCEHGPGTDGCFDVLVGRKAVRVEGRSGPDGRFTLAVPDGLTNFDHIWADGQDARGRRLLNSWPIRPNRPITATDLGTIALMRERELVVSVHGGGRPVAGAEVEFNRREKHRTDAQGAAAYRVFAPNESNSSGVALTVRAPGFAVEAWFGGMPSGSTTQVINLVAEAPLAGRVLNPDGLAVPDAVVALMPIEPWLGPVAVTGGLGPPDDTIARTRTDATGRYTLHGLSPSRTYRVTVESPPAFPSAGLERVVSGGTASADFVLRPAGRVDLDVAAPPGTESYLQRLGGSRNPAALPQIFIEWFDPETGNWQPARVAMQVVRADRESVRLRFDRVAAGTIRIVTEGDGVVAGDVSEAVPVLPGTASVVQVPLAPVHRLRVAVIDVQGRPVLGARVEAFAHTGRSSTYADTGRDGAVTLLVHPAHDVKVTVARSGQVEVTTVIPAGGNPAPIVLPQR